jgi:membrane-bound lytic murein transglycosylase B
VVERAGLENRNTRKRIVGSNPTLSATFLLGSFLLFTMLGAADAASAPVTQKLSPEVESFIAEMVQKHKFREPALRKLFAKVEPNQSILNAISTPLTARPWHEFRVRYVDEARINGGVKFWRQHAETLAAARSKFGVPEEIIVATIGVETTYGKYVGNHGVLEALSTLAFSYPPRSALFRSELEQYLLLAREAKVDAGSFKGSYAGAIGIPQFLPSSYRRYAIDFDGDGRRDLVKSTADAIGSVANYYKSHGWRAGAVIAVPTEVDPRGADALVGMGIRPRMKIADLKQLGVTPTVPVDDEAAAAVFVVRMQDGPRYWLGLNNFHVITRYNPSVNYALAVHELAQELRAAVKRGS